MARMNDRGQLLLAGAFVMAVALIGLTLVFTSGGYTTTLASQDNAVERGADAITVRESVESDLSRHLEWANSEYSSSPPPPHPESKFRAVVPEMSDGLRTHHSQHGRLVELSDSGSVVIHDGYRIRQTSDSDFERFSTAGSLEPALANDVKARNVTFIFSAVPTVNPFEIEFETVGSSEDWTVKIVESGSGWDVTVENSGGSYTATCTRPGKSSDMAVDVSDATVDGYHCPALEAIDLDSERYNIVFDGNQNDAAGRFWVTVDDLSVSKQTLYGSAASSGLTYDDVIYSAEAPFHYHSSSVEYRTDLYIAPGEIR